MKCLVDDKKKDQSVVALFVEGSFLFEKYFSGVLTFVVGFVYACFKPTFNEVLMFQAPG